MLHGRFVSEEDEMSLTDDYFITMQTVHPWDLCPERMSTTLTQVTIYISGYISKVLFII